MWLHTGFSPIVKGQIILLLSEVSLSIKKEGNFHFLKNETCTMWRPKPDSLYFKNQALIPCMIISIKFCTKILVYCTKSPRVKTLGLKHRSQACEQDWNPSLHLHYHPSPHGLTLPFLPQDTWAVSLATPFLVPLEKCSGRGGEQNRREENTAIK